MGYKESREAALRISMARKVPEMRKDSSTCRTVRIRHPKKKVRDVSVVGTEHKRENK